MRGRDGGVRVDAVRQELGRRLHLIPPAAPGGAAPSGRPGLPLWVDDPAFDLANHVHAVEVQPPGGERELLQLCDELRLRLLDRTHPLWELWLLDGLADGRVGLVMKLHHAMTDGLAAVQIAGILLGTAL
jgi:diacylglycerol O-acyltransferase / wax synthase